MQTIEQALEKLEHSKFRSGFRLTKKEREAGGVLDMDTKVVSTLTSHGAGYLDKDKETIVGFVFKIITDDNIKYKAVKNGVWFYSDIPSFYEKIIIRLCKMGLGSDIRASVEPDYQYLIDKVEPENNEND